MVAVVGEEEDGRTDAWLLWNPITGENMKLILIFCVLLSA